MIAPGNDPLEDEAAAEESREKNEVNDNFGAK
jgi:hypothetical protein